MPASKKTICVLTSTRAEYGLLYWLMKAIEKSSSLNLQVLVTGTHLAKEHGYTVQNIERDGFNITEKIEILSGNNNPDGIGKTAGNTISLVSAFLYKHKPDAMVLLGDRYEILAAAQAAVITRVPVIHLHGGEVSEGASDELFRHAITKLSSLHFTSSKEHRNRVIQLGEQPSRVKISGAMGIENIKKMQLAGKNEIETMFKVKLSENIFLVTFHPATLEKEKPEKQMSELLSALETFKSSTVFISAANADAGSDKINAMIKDFSSKHSNVVFKSSFGQLNYLSLMNLADVVIGNSSSGIIEAPSLNTATVNIGTRQKGRLSAKSVIHCKAEKNAIVSSIKKALQLKDHKLFKNPYDHGNASDKIVKELERKDFTKLLPKKFYDLPV